MERYKSYKPTVIKWIKEIPSHWKETKLKYIGSMYSGLSGKSGEDFKKPDHPQNKPFIPFTNIANNIQIDPNQLAQVVMHDDEEQNKVQEHDLFFMMSSENYADIGKTTILLNNLGDCYLNSFCKGFRVVDSTCHPPYLNYLLLNDAYRQRMMIEANGFTRINLKMEKVNDFEVSFPPFFEQKAISEYLDEKTRQIDKLIANKRKLIELLNEERTAVINRAVTIGINPDVKLKSSGSEWLGDIPEHWSLLALKFVVGYVKGYAFKADLFRPEGIPVVKASDIKRLTIRAGKDFLEPDDTHPFEKVRLQFKDIIISTVGSTPDVVNSAVGQIAKVPQELEGAYLNQNAAKFYSQNIKLLTDDFLFFSLVSHPYRKYLDLNAHGTANQASLNIEDMLNFVIAYPSVAEQRQIVLYIEDKATKIDNAVSKIEKEIELIQEYRTALISEVVTGKVKVG